MCQYNLSVTSFRADWTTSILDRDISRRRIFFLRFQPVRRTASLFTTMWFCGSTENGLDQVHQTKKAKEALKPLFLTPFIKAGHIQKGQKKAKVRDLYPKGDKNVKSYSGYLTVNSEYQSNLFFWFFPAMKNPEDAPLMVWLEGGPGEPGFFAVFVQNGPFSVNNRLRLEPRDTSWTKVCNMLYFDQPVGCGYSFTRDDKGYATSLAQSTDDLYEALTQFFDLFPTFRDNDFYVAGISYGGKFAAGLTERIIKKNQSGAGINLKGAIIASGFLDPVAMLDKCDYYYHLDIIDKITMDWGKDRYASLLRHHRNGNVKGGVSAYLEMNNRFLQVAGYDETSDFLPLDKAPDDYFHFEKFVQKKRVRRSLHVGNEEFRPYYGEEQIVFSKMSPDLISGIDHLMEVIMNESSLRVLIYHGNMDTTLVHTHLTNYLKRLDWPGANVLKETVPSVWRVNGHNAGHVTVADKLVYVIVRNAGHIVVHDQPEWSFDMLNKFLYPLDWS